MTCSRSALVTPSVMPKGVEHIRAFGMREDRETGVTPSVMPKGVEHLSINLEHLEHLRSDALRDAERR